METVTTDNVTVSGVMTNNGTIRKSKFGLTTGSTAFGLTGASIDVSTLGNLDTLQVDRVGSANANENFAGGGADTLDTYYTLTPDVSDQSFDLEVCLGYTDAEYATATVSDEANLRLCRWTGSGWVCPDRSASSSTSGNTACGDNVDTLSDWIIGELGPTPVTLHGLNAQSARDTQYTILTILILLGVSGLAAASSRRKATE